MNFQYFELYQLFVAKSRTWDSFHIADSLGYFDEIFQLHITLKPYVVKKDIYSYFLYIA